MKNKKLLIIIALVIALPLGVLASPFFLALTSSLQKSEIEKCRKLYNAKTQKSWERAYELTCSELARNGDGEAQYYVGMIVKDSPKIPDYKAVAYSFFYVANENGERGAKREMEGMKKVMGKRDLSMSYIILGNDSYSNFLRSDMLKKDDERSFKFLTMSSDLGSSSSQYNLCLSNSIGFHGSFRFPKNYTEAYKWCYLANLDPKISDNEKSQKAFSKLKSLMTQEQIKQGQELAKEWIKKSRFH